MLGCDFQVSFEDLKMLTSVNSDMHKAIEKRKNSCVNRINKRCFFENGECTQKKDSVMII